MIRIGFEFKSRKARDNYLDKIDELKRSVEAGSAIEISHSTAKCMSLMIKNTRRIQYSYYTVSGVDGAVITLRNKVKELSKLYHLTSTVCTLEGIVKYTVTIN
jgi:hypothetical protein